MELSLATLEAEIRHRDLQALESYRAGTAPCPVFYSSNFAGLQKAAEGDGVSPMVFVASSEMPDRFGDILSADGWDLDQYKQNPVVLFSHDHRILPVARADKVWVNDKLLLNTVAFDTEDPFAVALQGKYQRNMMRGESVGFRPIEFEPQGKGGMHFILQELVEISLVAVPANPEALRRSLGNVPFIITMPVRAVEILHPAPTGALVAGTEDTGETETILAALRSIREE